MFVQAACGSSPRMTWWPRLSELGDQARAVPRGRPDAVAAAGGAGAGLGAAHACACGKGRRWRAGGRAAVRRAGVQVLLRRAGVSAAAGGGGARGRHGGGEHAPAGRRAGGASSGLEDHRGGVRGSRPPSPCRPRGSPPARTAAGDGAPALADRRRPGGGGAPHGDRAASRAGAERRGAPGRRAQARALAGSLRPGAEHRVVDRDPQRCLPRTVAQRLRAPAPRLPARPQRGGAPVARSRSSIKFGTSLRGSFGEHRRQRERFRATRGLSENRRAHAQCADPRSHHESRNA